MNLQPNLESEWDVRCLVRILEHIEKMMRCWKYYRFSQPFYIRVISSQFMADREVQKVKVTGFLWTLRNSVAIIRDILLIVLLILLMFGAVMLIGALPSILQGAQSLTALPGMMQAVQTGDPDALLQQLQSDVNQGKWDAALATVGTIESMVSKDQLSAQDLQKVNSLKQALQRHDTAAFERVLAEIPSSFSQQK